MSKNNPSLKPIPVLKDINEINATLSKIAGLNAELKTIDKNDDERIAEIKAEAAKNGKRLRVQVRMLEKALRKYGKDNKRQICSNDSRSIELPFGVIGFRRSTILKVSPETMELLVKKFPKGVRVKRSIDKNELRKWSDEKLESVGAKKRQSDNFYYKLKLDVVNDLLMKQAG